MKVLYLTNLPSPYMVDFFSELAKKAELTVIYERSAASDRDEKWKNCDDSKIFNPDSYKVILLKGIKRGTDNSVSFGIFKYLKEKYDHIIIGDYATYTAMMAIRYLRKNKIPYILSTDGGFPNYEESSFKKKLKTYLIGGASKWLCTGASSRKYLEYYGARKEDVYIYPFTSLFAKDILKTPLTYESKQSLRKKLGLSGTKVVIGVGQFIPRKGWDVLIEGIDELNGHGNNDAFVDVDMSFDDIHYYIVGGEEEKLRMLLPKCTEIPANVHILPFMPKEELFQYYRAADAFVLPTREDIWGLVVNEAMANALPVITTDKCNAGLELVKEGVNGFIIETENSEALLKALRECLKDDVSSSMAEAALKTIEKYTHENRAEVTLSML